MSRRDTWPLLLVLVAMIGYTAFGAALMMPTPEPTPTPQATRQPGIVLRADPSPTPTVQVTPRATLEPLFVILADPWPTPEPSLVWLEPPDADWMSILKEGS